ncbi:ethanolamine ammonia-lyase subunit EutB [Aquabacterium sp. OR-4]|uniref:ethanolamine ammonia-lyase subunit EutB n=1 Tax=Aquabacterium sp. OR-4 TaxID=2978127 RepID=UPI0021B45731|nr:ethanolamine ammonia-lyase subunit EutB [Aquabacterium sp. OR-4]MDT7838178.1 ethanolamine ammonia-lyase subunit EutB [Aquabacterium sp. OR-4]
MSYRATVGTQVHRFDTLAQLLAKASPERSGDQLAGLAANSAAERVAARAALADLSLATFVQQPLLPADTDEVSRLIAESHAATAFAPVAHLTVGAFRDWLLSDAADGATLAALAPGLMPEMVAAVSKLMRNQDLMLVARRISVVTRFRNTLGLPGHLAVRLQPNHPADSPAGILASIVDGLMYGAGDAVIGVNPAGDNVDALVRLLAELDGLIQQHAIPTQACVLTHVTNTLQAMARGAPVDLVFQSIAGTEAANRSFGISLALLDEAHAAALALRRGTLGDNVMYFETGQGSALSANAHHGVDQQTLEARAYAVARRYRPLLVNTVVGFIGPEYLADGKQIIRAGLEDHFCGKLLGLPMGCDICYTNHADADSDDMDNLMVLLATAGLNFMMGVPGADDVMLNYQSTSFHDALVLRQLLGLKRAPEFEAWLRRQRITGAKGALRPVGPEGLLGAGAPALARAIGLRLGASTGASGSGH